MSELFAQSLIRFLFSFHVVFQPFKRLEASVHQFSGSGCHFQQVGQQFFFLYQFAVLLFKTLNSFCLLLESFQNGIKPRFRVAVFENQECADLSVHVNLANHYPYSIALLWMRQSIFLKFFLFSPKVQFFLTLFPALDYFIHQKHKETVRKMSSEESIEEETPESAAAEAAEAADAAETAQNAEKDEGTETKEPESVESLKNQVASLNETILRMAAENQNTRKRLVKQQQDAHKFRHQDILTDLVEVIDNFERAIESSAESEDYASFHEGVVMIEKQFSGMLSERYGLERLGQPGEPFDPALHEAMMVEESPEVEEETVKQVFQPGYRLHERVLRPAKVIVVKPAADNSAAESPEADENAPE